MRNTTLYKLAGPKTFRRSSTILWKKWGSNLQNVRKDIRGIYHTDGYKKELEAKCKFWLQTGDLSVFTEEELLALRVFLQTDQSGAEALIVAYDCESLDYRQLFIHGVKPHTYVAMKLFKDVWTRKMKENGGLIEDFDIDVIDKTLIRDLKKNPYWYDLSKLIADSDNWETKERYYYFAKQTVHSSNYDIQAYTFRMNVLEKSGGKIMISAKEAERFLMVYRGLFPEIPERNRRVAAQADKTGILYNMFGFPYYITNYNLMDDDYRKLYAWGPQSTVGEITRIAFSTLQQYIEQEQKPWDVMADTHDSYLVQCPLFQVKECKQKMEEFMNQKLVSPIDGAEFNMRSETNVGFNWAPFKKDTNVLGLQEPKWLKAA